MSSKARDGRGPAAAHARTSGLRRCEVPVAAHPDHVRLLLRLEETARILGISRAHAARLNASGKLPRPIRLGRAIRWSAEELTSWIEAGCPPRGQWEGLR